MRDAGPRSDPSKPWLRRPFAGYLVLLYVSAFAILLGVQFGVALLLPATSGDKVRWWVALGGIFVGVLGLCSVVAALLRHVATLSREIERLKEQSPNKPVNAPQGAEAPRAEQGSAEPNAAADRPRK
jgi:hypothetical protein